MLGLNTLVAWLYLLSCSFAEGFVRPEDLVREDRIKVFLYAQPAFWEEVAIDAIKDTCAHLTNSLIDGRVKSILIGGDDVVEVLQRVDNWYCIFYNNYSCVGDDKDTLIISDGINNLQSANRTQIHSLKCRIENEVFETDT
ncbi:hypothetical protein M011DRAFT_404765 [Sporormia fimetaria CBS 119925]|uniref:Uncharacterized protein n=1 Tax=Sporormia fimetaria CBS 119925 TaxID=1340428 RepID=A0A6A6VA14_9PLEO|nr:hypothetical protein M011DRAFT_404765 [Sporormia fimetaria CBS 119925]